MNDEKIYIAGSSREVPLIQNFMKIVREYGYEISHDWTQQDWAKKHSDVELTIKALADETAVRASDILWYVVPAEASGKSEGSAFELGVARGLGKVILVSGAIQQAQIFPRLPKLRFALHAEALECLRTRAWDTPETDLLRTLTQADSVTIPNAHLGLKRAAEALAAEGRVHIQKLFTGSYVVTKVK